jgi:hypothetical protein
MLKWSAPGVGSCIDRKGIATCPKWAAVEGPNKGTIPEKARAQCQSMQAIPTPVVGVIAEALLQGVVCLC